MTVDECEALGLTVDRFSEETLKKFQELKDQNIILKIAATSNPVDLTGSVTDDMFVMAADLIFQEPDICGIILLGLHHMPGLREVYIDGLVKVAESYTKPIVMCDIGETEMALYTRSRFDKLGVPSFESPEDAARAMKALVTYGSYLQKIGCFDEYMVALKKTSNTKPSQ
jgi:acyl-CoA synthetase (NDP forming)